jgi:hypothetical protein
MTDSSRVSKTFKFNSIQLYGYTILSGPTVIISSESEETACSSINYINGLPLRTLLLVFLLYQFFDNLELNARVYLNNTLDCSTSNGWYFTDETALTKLYSACKWFYYYY